LSRRQVANLLAAAGVVWSIGVGIWIWVTPIRFVGISNEAWAWSGPGSTASGMRVVPVERTRRFADVSLLGPVPLAIPVALAGLAALAVWRRKGALLTLLPAVLLLAFCFIAGFSIGAAYVPAGCVVLLAVLLNLGSR